MDALTELVAAGNVAVLSGAGISTESGIPDYRGPTGAARRNHVPMTHQEFVNRPDARHRYWARSYLGWSVFSQAQPNDGHRAVAALERSGPVIGVITQNVDGLHQAAGSNNVIDLHGRLDRVMCLACGAVQSRHDVQDALLALNADWDGRSTVVNPDGDVELDASTIASFNMVDCTDCGGALKPDVVYFGGSVPPAWVAAAHDLVDRASALLVLGSSLTVFSGRRFVHRAVANGVPVAIVNQGETRCDELASVRIEAPLGRVLMSLTQKILDFTIELSMHS